MEGSGAKKRPGLGSKTSSTRMTAEYRTRDGEQKECVVEVRITSRRVSFSISYNFVGF